MGNATTALVALTMVANLARVGYLGDIKLQTAEPPLEAPVVDTLTMPTTIERMALLTDVYALNISDADNTANETIQAEEATYPKPYVERVVDKSKLSKEVIALAKTVWGEAQGCPPTEQAAVVWCILNRVDSDLHYMPDSIIEVITQKSQFTGYSKKHPVKDEIVSIVLDVLERWEAEKAGITNVGRVLPKQYLYFHGDGRTNHFRDSYRGGNRWGWHLESPYV